MALQVSTGFKAALLGHYAFEDIFNGGVIRVFSGAQPVNANAAQTGTLLGVVTLNGDPWTAGTATNGLTFQRDGAIITNLPRDRWLLSVAAAGAPGWWRLIEANGDQGYASLSSPRIDGAIGVLGEGLAEMYLDATMLSPGLSQLISSFFYTIPPL